MKVGVVVVLGCLPLGGCSVFGSIFGDNRLMAPHSHLESSGLYTYLTSTFFETTHIQKLLEEYYKTTGSGRRTAIRNEIVGNMIYLIDVEYSKYADDVLQSSKALLDTSLGISGLGLTAAATITGHEATAKLLSGIATAVQGSRELIDKNVYLQKTVPTVVAAMDAARAEQFASILRGLTQDADQYPLSVALRDVGEYYHRGTMVRAFAGMSDIVGKAKDEADKEVGNARFLLQAR